MRTLVRSGFQIVILSSFVSRLPFLGCFDPCPVQ